MTRLIPLVLLLAAACAHKSASSGSYGYAESYAEPYPEPPMELDYADVEEASSSRGRGGPPPSPSRKPAAPSPVAAPPPPPPPGEPAPAAADPLEQAPVQRMVHYDGWARMRATDPAETLDGIAALATEAGGRVDRLSGSTLTVRVPVDRFDEIWKQVLALGDVLDKSVRADDVTDQFMAVDLRVRTLRMTRDRLVQLLAKAQSEEEKLALLQEITRVTEELDATESQLRTLADLAAMSRISVDVVPREAFGASAQGPALAGMEWIRGLSPFRRGVFEDDKRVTLGVPDGLVSLSKSGPFVAESADGSVLWTLRVPNDPVGGGAFWIGAIEETLAAEFASAERRDVGGWACLAVDEPGADDPYRWQICLAPAGRHLQVAQAFYPNAAQLERYGPLVDDVLKAGGGS